MNYIKVSYCVTTKFDEGAIIAFLGEPDEFDRKEPTDLDAEAEEFTEEFINDCLIGSENEADGDTWLNKKESAGFNKLKEKIKHYIYLKRHDPDRYEKLLDEAY